MANVPKYRGFDKLSADLKRRGVKDPEALAASIGRKKYSAKVFNKAAATGRSLRGVPPYRGRGKRGMAVPEYKGKK